MSYPDALAEVTPNWGGGVGKSCGNVRVCVLRQW